MKKSLMAIVIMAASLLGQGGAFAKDTVWMTDFEQARTLAGQTGKDLLVNFSGSDWCHWCERLKAEVTGDAKFIETVQEKFVLVEIDFPDKIKLPEKVQKQNEELAAHYGVEGFPTVLLVDEAGRAYAQTGYCEGGVQSYIEHLEQLRLIKSDRDRYLSLAHGKSGEERAKMLDGALGLMAEQGVLSGYKDLVEEIKLLDRENKSGLREKYVLMGLRDRIEAIIYDLSETDEYEKAAQEMDDIIVDVSYDPQLVQGAYLLKAKIYKDYDADDALVTKALSDAYDAFPEGPSAEFIKAGLAQ